jgi:hypothetical protein
MAAPERQRRRSGRRRIQRDSGEAARAGLRDVGLHVGEEAVVASAAAASSRPSPTSAATSTSSPVRPTTHCSVDAREHRDLDVLLILSQHAQGGGFCTTTDTSSRTHGGERRCAGRPQRRQCPNRRPYVLEDQSGGQVDVHSSMTAHPRAPPSVVPQLPLQLCRARCSRHDRRGPGPLHVSPQATERPPRLRASPGPTLPSFVNCSAQTATRDDPRQPRRLTHLPLVARR